MTTFAPKRSLLPWTVIACLLASLVGGCIGLVPSPFRPSPGPRKAPAIHDLAEAFDIVCRNYRLGPDDTLGFVVYPDWRAPEGPYKLDVLDRLRIKFLLDPELNEDVIVRPDGMITIQGIGDIKAAGLTPPQLAKRIEEKFDELGIFHDRAKLELKNQQVVTVHVQAFNQKLDTVTKSITTIAGGQQRVVVVKPDGTIDLPLLDERILAAGHTVSDVEKTVNRAYQRGVLPDARISLSLSEARSRKFYIFGEVSTPGAYEIRQPITVAQAIALAGGHFSVSADLTSVILISKNIYGKPIGRRIDVKRMLDIGDMSGSILVKPYDVIYVPKTYIRDLRVFMEEYLNTISGIAGFYNTLVSVTRNTR